MNVMPQGFNIRRADNVSGIDLLGAGYLRPIHNRLLKNLLRVKGRKVCPPGGGILTQEMERDVLRKSKSRNPHAQDQRQTKAEPNDLFDHP